MPKRSGSAIFPGQTVNRIIGVRLFPDDLKLWRASNATQLAIPTIVGCVYYETGGVPHHTGYILEVDNADGQPQNGAISFLPIDTTKGDVPASKIAFGVNPDQPSLND